MGSFPYERVGAAAMGVPLELCTRVMIKRANLARSLSEVREHAVLYAALI